MKIITDTRMLGKRIHGLGRYIYEIFRVWREKNVPHEFTLLTNEPEALKSINFFDGCSIIKMKSSPFSPGNFVELHGILKRSKADLFHATSVSVPAFPVVPSVITIHDLIPFYSANLHSKLYMNLILKRAVKASKAVITSSEFSKTDIIKYTNADADKISVIYDAAADRPAGAASWEEAAKKYNITKPYLFCVANPRPHKNVKGLIEIYNILREKWSGQLNLVIASRTSPDIENAVESSPFKNEIIRIDYLEEDELDLLYSNASIFTFPSLFEGFGLPPLEAMRRGCPVISSGRTSLGEIVGEGGIIVDPDNRDEFALKIKMLLEDNNLRDVWSSKATEWEAQFSWERCALETLQILEKAVNSK